MQHTCLISFILTKALAQEKQNDRLVCREGARQPPATTKTVTTILSACFVAAMVMSASAAEKVRDPVRYKLPAQ
jgi:hypothetical protein